MIKSLVCALFVLSFNVAADFTEAHLAYIKQVLQIEKEWKEYEKNYSQESLALIKPACVGLASITCLCWQYLEGIPQVNMYTAIMFASLVWAVKELKTGTNGLFSSDQKMAEKIRDFNINSKFDQDLSELEWANEEEQKIFFDSLESIKNAQSALKYWFPLGDLFS